LKLAAVTVFPVYENDQNSNPSQYLYCEDWHRLVTKEEIKGYKVHHRGSHYYNLRHQILVDFEYKMVVEEAGIRALRGLADDLLDEGSLNLKHVIENKTRSRRLK
jgi:hypothetical protein